jgi:hypothetical protein
VLQIYNACWKLSYFPRFWKTGKLIVLVKDPTGDYGNIKNYRPITLLPVYGKILEKLIKKRLNQQVSPLHSSAQFGFVAGRSTTDALMKYKEAIRSSPRKYVLTLFVDLKGAFDNVWCPGLIRHMRARGFSQNITALVKTYLTAREITFEQNNVTINKEISKGCPQESVNWPDDSTVIAYADDPAIVVTDNSRASLISTTQQVISKVLAWANDSKLTISVEKTVFMINKSPPPVHHRDIRFYIGAERVKLVDQHKYLGIIVDPKLSFEQNAAYAVKKARRVIMGLKRKTARHWGQETQDSLRKIYYGAILPILSYASRVWIDRIHLSKIKRKYLSAYGTVARLLTQSYVSVSTEAAGVLAGILPWIWRSN